MTGKQTPPTGTTPSPSRPPRVSAVARAHTTRPLLSTDANACAVEETRRSGRANKGQHTKNHDALDEPPVPKTKAQLKAEKSDKSEKPDKPEKSDKKGPSKSKGEAIRAQSAQSADQEQDGDEEEDDAIIRCVCGDQRDIRGRQMICCDQCEAWQHNKCLSLPEGDYWEDKTYYCEQCRPQDHQELLAAMARGEKPWARKKGSKPKARPSDVKQEEKATTPQQSTGAGTPSQGPTQAPADAPTPTPASLSAEPQEASNGHSESKARTEVSSQSGSAELTSQQDKQSQPQSPLGEKRRLDAASDKANASKKRRKSSQQQDKTASQSAPVTDIDALPPTQKPFAEKLRDTLTPLINTASSTRGYRIPDGETAKSLASRISLHISLAAVEHYGEPSGGDSPFAQRVRGIMFNVKRNAILVDRLLSGSLKPQELITMAIEEMASEDKQREFAALREAAEKQMILTDEPGPRLRKTHKGEEIVGEDSIDADDFKQPVLRERESISEDVPMQSPIGHRPPESPADASNPLAVNTGSHPDSARRPSTNFDINSVFDKVRSPQADQQNFLLRRQSSIQMHEKQQAPVDDADVDRLLKDEDNDVDMAGYSSDPTVCWQGSISMQSLQSFDAVARFVAGGDFGQVVPWDKLLSSALSVQGRIESAKGDDYIRGIGHSEVYDVAILALSPVTTEGRAVMDHFYTYFHSRGRWGVVPVENTGNDILRDLYIIPIEAGGSNLPPFIDMLEYCTIETPRKEHMVLLALVAKLPEVKPQLPTNEQFERYPPQEAPTGQTAPLAPSMTGPSPSPVASNPHGPQYSPMAAHFPPGQYGNQFAPPPANGGHQQPPPQFNIPPHHQIPKALEIFGPHIDAPVVVQILIENLSKNEAVSELQMNNIRHIVETNPAARTDMSVFTSALFKQQKSGTNGQ